MKQILLLVISLLFIGCGDGEDRVGGSGSQDSNVNVVVPLEVGETRTFPLNIQVDRSYLVTAESADSDTPVVSYRIDYLNRTYPEVVVTGETNGTEDFTVIAEDAGGIRQTALIRAYVNGSSDVNGTDVDIAGTIGGGTTTDGDGTGGDGTGDGSTPPIVNPVSDPDACNDSDPTWGTVGDSWGTTEGQYSTDLLYWIRSQISVEPSNIVLYYKRVAVSSKVGYVALGDYTYTISQGVALKFEMQMLQELVGKSTYFYIKWNNDCYRGITPTSILMAPDKTLTPVFSGSI